MYSLDLLMIMTNFIRLNIRPKNYMETFTSKYDPNELVDVQYTLIDEIKSWIDSNTLIKNQKSIWKIGIAHGNDIQSISTTIRQDHQYRHYRHWKLKSFEHSIKILSVLNKHPFVFKSPLNNYLSKGSYVFVYKTPCENQTKRLFYKTLNS